MLGVSIMENKESVNNLKKFLLGENMAVLSYSIFINAANDKKIRSELASIQEEHKQHANELRTRIREFGEKTKVDINIRGKIGRQILKFKTRNRKDIEILKRAYDGENKGISTAEKFLSSELDNKSYNIIGNALLSDQEHLQKLRNLILENK
jgi:rubrerythrin